jgi:hypothetical protein
MADWILFRTVEGLQKAEWRDCVETRASELSGPEPEDKAEAE